MSQITKTKHPGKTKAQRCALDLIGCGNSRPPMSTRTRDAMLSAGLIEPCGVKVYGSGWSAVRVTEYQMLISVHIQWCAYCAETCPEDAIP